MGGKKCRSVLMLASPANSSIRCDYNGHDPAPLSRKFGDVTGEALPKAMGWVESYFERPKLQLGSGIGDTDRTNVDVGELHFVKVLTLTGSKRRDDAVGDVNHRRGN
ncbi:hypothetical protein NPIL_236471 [Nephila pilipes]|uniref:Uncharacterized protein n=1 Tax=Nephila pilipes TaxID=299642 RepID=A0A8X6TE31_NEPPI|nr:hypothetical protein NPIL_236471 [Nephila pilipes]